MSHFHCLDYNVYLQNPAWFNEAALALIKTENIAMRDKQKE
jgi:hypothetical protein